MLASETKVYKYATPAQQNYHCTRQHLSTSWLTLVACKWNEGHRCALSNRTMLQQRLKCIVHKIPDPDFFDRQHSLLICICCGLCRLRFCISGLSQRNACGEQQLRVSSLSHLTHENNNAYISQIIESSFDGGCCFGLHTADVVWQHIFNQDISTNLVVANQFGNPHHET